jgi:hypothetical protein
VFKFSDGFFCDNNAGWPSFGVGNNVIHNAGCWGTNSIQFTCPAPPAGVIPSNPGCMAHICTTSACEQNQFGAFCVSTPGILFKFTDGWFCDNNAGFAAFGTHKNVIHNALCWGNNKVTFV